MKLTLLFFAIFSFSSFQAYSQSLDEECVESALQSVKVIERIAYPLSEDEAFELFIFMYSECVRCGCGSGETLSEN